MLNLILKELKNNKLYYFFILMGYVSAILVVSFSISFIKISEDITLDFSEGYIKNQRILNVSNQDKALTIDPIIEIAKNFSKNNTITISGFSYETIKDIELGEVWIIPIQLVAFKEKPSWIPKIINGNYFSYEESNSNKNIAVVGSGIIKNNISSKSNITIGENNYTIIGNAGKLEDCSDYLGTIFLPINSLPNELKNNVKTIEIKIDNNNGNANKEAELLEKELCTNLKVNVELYKPLNSGTRLLKSIAINSTIIITTCAVAIVNILIMLGYMLIRNKKKLTISIALGLNKKLLVTQIFYILMIISSIASIFALIIQQIMTPIVKSNLNKILNISELSIYSLNIVIILLIIIMLNLIISIISINKIYKEDLSKELKND